MYIFIGNGVRVTLETYGIENMSQEDAIIRTMSLLENIQNESYDPYESLSL